MNELKTVNVFTAFLFVLALLPAAFKQSAREKFTRMGEIRSTLMDTIGPLVGVAIGIVVVVTIAAIGIIGAQNSANLTSATTQIGAFLPLVGIAIGLAVFLVVLKRV